MTGVRVKALVWERDSLGWGWWADSILGSYRVFNGSRWRLCGCGDTQGTDAGNEDAQADYETRILAALEPQDAPAVAEELVALRAENARLRKALTFYANPEIYRPHPNGPAFDRRDVSYVATAALTPPASQEGQADAD